MADSSVLDPTTVIPQEMLEAFRERAADYDRENRFFTEDFADLRGTRYLQLLVPTELGGLGASLLEAGRVQRTLAQYAPATALAMNMHLVITGAALHAHRRGSDAGRAILEGAAAGKLFAFGISEAGNEAMLFDAFSTAEATAAGGYHVSGTKIFTSLAPAWDHLVVHAKTTSGADDGADPQLVFGFIDRTDAVQVADDWDTHGMRATQSCTTTLENAEIAPDHVITHTPVSPSGDPFVMGIFGCFSLLIGSVYTGIAERAVQVGTEIATTRRNRVREIMHSDDPDIRWRLADAAIRTDGTVLQLEKMLADFDALGTGEHPQGFIDHGPKWFLLLSNTKARATESAIAAVDQVLRASGGSHFFRRSELERLSRDVRAGMYHPADEEAVHSSYAGALLGPVGEHSYTD